MDERKAGRHRLIIEQREDTTIEGVSEVISFDEESVVCETIMGTMVIKGHELHIEKLNLEQGVLAIVGEVESLEYGDENAFTRASGGLLGRIFK